MSKHDDWLRGRLRESNPMVSNTMFAGSAMAVEIADELQSLSSKLDKCVEALECLLPGLIFDLRYADPDDDRDAMQSRIKTVTDALEATK